MSADYASLTLLVNEIKQLCRANSVGTLFISTRDNKSAQVIFDQGQIVAASYSGEVGEEAIKKLVANKEVRFRFQNGIVLRRTLMPPTNEILQFLDGNVADKSGGPVKSERQVVAESTLSSAEKMVLTELLAVAIGPMAELVAAEHLQVASDASDAIKRLAKEIPSQESTDIFVQDAVAKIKEIGR